MRTLVPYAVTLAALSLAPVPAQATPPQDVTLVTLVSYLPAPSFTWSSTGASADGGELEFLSARWGTAGPAPAGELLLEMRLHGARGTIDLHVALLAKATPTPDLIAFDGPWVVKGATGDYARLRGGGTVHVIDGRVDRKSDLAHPEIGVFRGRLHVD